MENKTWQAYEKGRDYLDQKALVAKTQRNWNFYLGEQWAGLQSGGEELPMFNFITPTIKYKVATVAQNRMAAQYTDMYDRQEYEQLCEELGKDFMRMWEKSKMDDSAWKVVKYAAIEGDSYIYWGNFSMEDGQVLHTTQIMFGNEQEPDIQKQPYIILRGRESAESLRKEAKENGVPESDYSLIVPDEDTTREVGNKEEVKEDGKCTYIIYLTKKEGIVYAEKRTEYSEVAPMRAIENLDAEGNRVGGLKLYPICGYIWERKPNDSRGKSEVERLIPNQLETNKTLARRSMTVKMTAYPRLAYDANAIQNPDDLDKVGAAIGLNGAASGIDTMIKYLNPASMSHDAQTLLQDLVNTTKELAGAGDMALGNVSPERASGAAITAVRDQAALPLNEQISAFNQFVEDVANLAYEMMTVSSPNGIQLADGMVISGEELRDLKPSIRIDVSPDNGWTKYSAQQELADLLSNNQIDLQMYLEALPEGGALPKNKLLALLAAKTQETMAEQEAMNGNLQMQDLRSGMGEALG